MLEETHKFDFTLVRLASNFAKMLVANFCTVVDEDCSPEMLYERVTEKFVPETVIIFLKDA